MKVTRIGLDIAKQVFQMHGGGRSMMGHYFLRPWTMISPPGLTLSEPCTSSA